MAEKPSAEKTEQPTQRRLEKAQKEGQVAQSQELPAVISVAVLTLVLAMSAPSLLKCFMALIEKGLSAGPGIFVDNDSFVRYFNFQVGSAMVAMLPLFASLFIAGILSCVVVSGLNFSPEALKLKFDEIDPVKGFLFHMQRLTETLRRLDGNDLGLRP